MFMAENETTPSATTLDVVEIAPHASPSNKLGINLIERIEFVGKNAIIVASNIKGHGGSRFIQSMNVAEASVKTYNTKSTKQERGRSLHLLTEKFIF
jgi:hypothetical protein